MRIESAARKVIPRPAALTRKVRDMLNVVRYKDQIYPDYKIDTETGEVFHGDEKLVQKLSGGKYLYVRIEGIQMHVHCIQAQSEWGYRPDNDVHHEDGNKMNNALSNLNYDLTHGGHIKLEKTGKKCSEETKRRMSEAKKRDSTSSMGRNSLKKLKEK